MNRFWHYLTGKDCGAYYVANATCEATIGDDKYKDEKNCTCDPGFELKAGNLTRRCTTAGMWDGAEPVCNSMSFSLMSPILDCI